MKLKNIILALGLGLTATALNGAVYTITNGSGVDGYGILDASGNIFQNSAVGTAVAGGLTSAGPGSVQIGIFTSSDDALRAMNFEQLVADFSPMGASTSTALSKFAAAGLAGTQGLFSAARNQPITGTPFSGQIAYLFVGNAEVFAESTEYLLVKTSLVFNDEDDKISTGVKFIINPEESIVIQGTLLEVGPPTTKADQKPSMGWQMVPEPSVALLGALGMLGFLRRRR